MTKRHLIAGAVILLVSVGLLFTLACSKTPPSTPPTTDPIELAKSAQKLPGPAQLPDLFERRGLISKRFGSVRLYVLVSPEIQIQRTVEGQDRTVILDRVTIRVVLENETYSPLSLQEAQISTADLFTLTVTKSDSNEEVFTAHQLSAEVSGWEPAERKTFNIDWPLESPAPGTYLIAVTAGFGDRSTVQIRTTLR
jgi:hypothetical protein